MAHKPSTAVRHYEAAHGLHAATRATQLIRDLTEVSSEKEEEEVEKDEEKMQVEEDENVVEEENVTTKKCHDAQRKKEEEEVTKKKNGAAMKSLLLRATKALRREILANNGKVSKKLVVTTVRDCGPHYDCLFDHMTQKQMADAVSYAVRQARAAKLRRQILSSRS